MKKILKPAILILGFLVLTRYVWPEEKKPSWPRFSIKLTGGGGYALIGDINHQLSLVNKNETFEYWRKHDPSVIAGEIKTLNHWFYDWEAELRMDLSRTFGIGIAISAPFQRKNESTLSIAAMEERGSGPQITEMYYRPEIKVSVPIKLNFYYLLSYRTRYKLFFNGGIGYYPGRMSQDNRNVIDYSSSETTYWEVKSRSSLGYHLGASIEYSLTRSTDLVLDILGRIVMLKDLHGWIQYEKDQIISEKYSGTLFFMEDPEERIPGFIERGYLHEEVQGYLSGNIRKAIIDLSGVVVRAGIKIHLF